VTANSSFEDSESFPAHEVGEDTAGCRNFVVLLKIDKLQRQKDIVQKFTCL